MILDRIKQFIDSEGIAVSAFEKSIGMSNASFGKSLRNGGAIVDPWGTPYRVTIRSYSVNVKFNTVNGALNTGYYLPNLYWNEMEGDL